MTGRISGPAHDLQTRCLRGYSRFQVCLSVQKYLANLLDLWPLVVKSLRFPVCVFPCTDSPVPIRQFQ